MTHDPQRDDADVFEAGDPFDADCPEAAAAGDDPFADLEAGFNDAVASADLFAGPDEPVDDFVVPASVRAEAEPGDSPLAIAIRSLTAALESIAFVAATPADPAREAPLAAMRVRLDFGGPRAGRLCILAEPALGRMLVAGALGVDPEAPEAGAGADDAMRELANVAAGFMMPGLVGQAEALGADACPLGLPQLDAATHADWLAALTGESDGSHVALDVEGRLMLVGLRCDHE